MAQPPRAAVARDAAPRSAFSSAPALWAAVHLPELPLEAFMHTLAGGGLEQRPIALIDDHRISIANEAARALGVRPGLKRPTALALAPDLVVGMADVCREREALGVVAQAALAFTPAVALEPPQTVLLEVHASLRLFGGLPRLLQRLRAAIEPLGHRMRIATAPTALGAALLAAWREDCVLGRHTADRLALAQRLDEAPIALLSTSGREHELLQAMGLSRLAELRALPRSGVARRFGPALLEALDRAYGEAPEPRDWVLPPRRFEARLELFARADHSEQLLGGAAVLLQRLLAWAGAWHARVASFTLLLHHEARRRVRESDTPACTPLPVVLGEATTDAAHLQTVLAERLARMPLAAPVLELGLQAEELVYKPAPNGELFPSANAEREGLLKLVDRLQARLGREGVRRLQTVADHRPERDTASLPVNGASNTGLLRPIEQPPLPQMPMRPLWRLTPPQRLRARELQPLHEGRPLQLLAGPERIESGWWDGGLTLRDYFVAEAADGSLLWVYRERLPEGDEAAAPVWFLHGRFG